MKSLTKTFLVTVVIAALVGLVAVLEVQRQAISAQLQEDVPQQVEDGKMTDEQVQNQELAQKIIAEVRALITIDESVEPTVATIVDVEALRTRNSFYNKAENGDHLVVTRERAILYSSKNKKIIDVVPIQLEPAEVPENASDTQ
jgi:predicted ATPase